MCTVDLQQQSGILYFAVFHFKYITVSVYQYNSVYLNHSESNSHSFHIPPSHCLDTSHGLHQLFIPICLLYLNVDRRIRAKWNILSTWCPQLLRRNQIGEKTYVWCWDVLGIMMLVPQVALPLMPNQLRVIVMQWLQLMVHDWCFTIRRQKKHGSGLFQNDAFPRSQKVLLGSLLPKQAKTSRKPTPSLK